MGKYWLVLRGDRVIRSENKRYNICLDGKLLRIDKTTGTHELTPTPYNCLLDARAPDNTNLGPPRSFHEPPLGDLDRFKGHRLSIPPAVIKLGSRRKP
jgi:hypothetical protein